MFAVAAKSPTNTASALGGMRDIFIAAKPLFNIFTSSFTGVFLSVSVSASPNTHITASYARALNCAAAGRSSRKSSARDKSFSSALKYAKSERIPPHMPDLFVFEASTERPSRNLPRILSTASKSKPSSAQTSCLGARLTPPRKEASLNA